MEEEEERLTDRVHGRGEGPRAQTRDRKTPAISVHRIDSNLQIDSSVYTCVCVCVSVCVPIGVSVCVCL